MANVTTIQAVLAIALLFGWAYSHMTKSGSGSGHKKGPQKTKDNSKSPHQKKSGAKN